MEVMATIVRYKLPPQLGSHMTPSCATSGVLMAMVASVELVNPRSSVRMLDLALNTTVMILTTEVVAAECNGASGIHTSVLSRTFSSLSN